MERESSCEMGYEMGNRGENGKAHSTAQNVADGRPTVAWLMWSRGGLGISASQATLDAR